MKRLLQLRSKRLFNCDLSKDQRLYFAVLVIEEAMKIFRM